MLDPNKTVLFSEDWEQIGSVVNQIVPQLAPEIRKPFNLIKLQYLAEYGLKGLYDRVNGRTVSQVLVEYHGPKVEVVSEGEQDGVRFTVYELPPTDQDSV